MGLWKNSLATQGVTNFLSSGLLPQLVEILGFIPWSRDVPLKACVRLPEQTTESALGRDAGAKSFSESQHLSDLQYNTPLRMQPRMRVVLPENEIWSSTSQESLP